MISTTMSSAFESAAQLIAKSAVEDAITKLAKKYGFDPSEASEFLLSGGIIVKKPLIPEHAMPWCGKVRIDCCRAIVLNNGLFTQCPLAKKDESDYCKKCNKHVESHGTPKYGDVAARLACGPLEYTVGKRTVIPYSVYMAKHKIDKKDVEAAALEYGLVIDPVQFQEKKRGRPAATNREMAIPETTHDADETEAPAAAEPVAEPVAAEEPAEEAAEEESEEETEGITYSKIMSMTAAEIRALATENNIETKDADGKIIKVTELRKQLLEKLNLRAT